MKNEMTLAEKYAKNNAFIELVYCGRVGNGRHKARATRKRYGENKMYIKSIVVYGEPRFHYFEGETIPRKDYAPLYSATGLVISAEFV